MITETLEELVDNDVRLEAAVHGIRLEKAPRRRYSSRDDNIDKQFLEAKKRGLPVVEIKDGNKTGCSSKR